MKKGKTAKANWFYKQLVLVVLLLSSHLVHAQSIIGWGDNFNHQCDVGLRITNPIAIAAGGFHNLVLQEDGKIVGWGKNSNGQTSVPTSASNVVAIAAGRDHSLGLRSDGFVVAWGLNTDGQTNVPAAASNIVAISAGSTHSVALRSDGTVIAWGNNDYGQTNIPSGLTDVIAISSGYFHNLALRSDHTIIEWGSQSVVPPSATNVAAIAAGFQHCLALTFDGSVVAWGDNTFGQSTVPSSLANVIAISAGWGHSMALLSNGHVITWGMNYPGITNAYPGFNNVTNVPVGVTNVASISSGEGHDLALVRSGLPHVNVQTQIIVAHVGGETLFTPVISGTQPLNCQWYHANSAIDNATNRWLKLTNVQTADAGEYALVVSNSVGKATNSIELTVLESPFFLTPLPIQHNAVFGTPLCLPVVVRGAPSLAFQSQLNGSDLVDGGRISGTTSSTICFDPISYEDFGTLNLVAANGHGSFTGLVANVIISPIFGWGDNSLGQISVPFSSTNVVALACGADHSLALRADGTVTAWGDNSFSQNTVPMMVTNVVAVADGETHSLALRADGSVIAWGDNLLGQTNVPGTVLNAIAIAAGAQFSQAVLSNGQIIKWGAGSAVPASATNVMLISTRENNSLALRADGKLVQWGTPALVPPSDTNFISISTAEYASLALRADGSVVAWGLNYDGLTNVPGSVTNVVSIAAGDDCFLALRNDGTVIAWGNTNFNQCAIPSNATNIESIYAGSIHGFALIGEPFKRDATAGETVVFTAGPLTLRLATYQWQFNGVNVSGATNATLVLNNVHSTNSGVYRVIVSYPFGSLASPQMSLSVPLAPLIFDTSNFKLLTNGAVQMHLVGSSGVNPVTLYASSNLVDWYPILTNAPMLDPIEFTDTPPAELQQRYYRAVEHP